MSASFFQYVVFSKIIKRYDNGNKRYDIEYKNGSSYYETNSNPDNIFVNYQTLNYDDFDVNEDFNFNPFRITNTMGLLRYEYPIE